MKNKLISLRDSTIASIRAINVYADLAKQWEFLITVLSSFSDDGVIYLCKKTGEGFIQEAIRVSSIKQSAASGNIVILGDDVYISACSFLDETSRAKHNVCQYNCNFVDIDFKDSHIYKGKSPEESCKIALNYIKDRNITEPSLVVFTGHGLHLWWCYDKAYGVEWTNVWTKVQESLVRNLSQIGADQRVKDAGRILRVPGTLNAKDEDNKVMSKTLHIREGNRYIKFETMYNLAKKFHKEEDAKVLKKLLGSQVKDVPLHQIRFIAESRTILPPNAPVFTPFINFEANATPPVPPKLVRKRGGWQGISKDAEFSKRRATRLLMEQNRINDLFTLVDIRGGKMTGHRESSLFVLGTLLSRQHKDFKEMLQIMKEMNNLFSEPLSEYEVKTVAWQPKALYTFKNETLIDMLGITKEEEAFMQTILSQESRALLRRNKNKSKMTREEKRDFFIREICLGMAKGMKRSEIATKLGCSVVTIRNYINKHKLNTVWEDYLAEHGLSVHTQNEAEAEKLVKKEIEKVNKKEEKVLRNSKRKKKKKMRRAADKIVACAKNLAQRNEAFLQAMMAFSAIYEKKTGKKVIGTKKNGNISYYTPFKEVILGILSLPRASLFENPEFQREIQAILSAEMTT